MNLDVLGRKLFKIENTLLKEFLSELLSTFLLIAFGCGSNAQYVIGSKDNFNSFLSINFAWGLAVSVGVLVGGNVSGAHMNPALSLSLTMLGHISLVQFFVYILAQSIGSFLGSIFVYLIYLDALNSYDYGVRQVYGPLSTAKIFGTYPAAYITIGGAFLDQIFASMLLFIIILAILDKRNNSDLSHALKAIFLGSSVFLMGLSFGMNTGYALNPVRDFIPRLFTLMSGWGLEVFRAGNYFFWIPIVAPFLGAILATCVYSFLIGNHLPDTMVKQ